MAGLERAGVDFIIMAANSPHSVFQDIVKRTDLPIHSISDATMNKAKELKLKKLLLFGIKHTMDSNFYPESGAEYDIEIIVPTDREKTIIDGIIFSELCIGKIIDRSKSKLLDIINSYDVDGVILGCTELPLIINETDLNIAVLNTLEIHVENTLLKCMR
jgi:aspartate racemase